MQIKTLLALPIYKNKNRSWVAEVLSDRALPLIREFGGRILVFGLTLCPPISSQAKLSPRTLVPVPLTDERQRAIALFLSCVRKA